MGSVLKGAVDAIQQMLENLGYKVTARTSSIEALEAFRNKSDSLIISYPILTNVYRLNCLAGKDESCRVRQIRYSSTFLWFAAIFITNCNLSIFY